MSRRKWNVKAGLVSLGCQQEGGNSPGQGLVGRVFDLSHSQIRVLLSLLLPRVYLRPEGHCREAELAAASAQMRTTGSCSH